VASFFWLKECGVCSNARDVWTKMSSLDNIAPRTTFCAVSYLTSKDFEALINCMFDIGYTEECALEWAHYTVLNTLLCAGDCIPDTSNTIVGNGPPPECELTSCFACAQEKFRLDDVHYQMTGYSGVKGGIIDRAPSYNCSDFQAVVTIRALEPTLTRHPLVVAVRVTAPMATGRLVGLAVLLPRR